MVVRLGVAKAALMVFWKVVEKVVEMAEKSVDRKAVLKVDLKAGGLAVKMVERKDNKMADTWVA